jgi:hypothetical protein
MSGIGGWDGDDTKIKGPDETIIGNIGDNLKTADVIDSGNGVQGNLTVGTSAVEAKVGGTALPGRKSLTIQPKDNGLYWGYTSGVTTSTGTQLFKNSTSYFDISDNQSVYLIADGAGKDVRVTEA